MEKFKGMGIALIILFSLSLVASLFLIFSNGSKRKQSADFSGGQFEQTRFMSPNSIAVLNIYSSISYSPDSESFFMANTAVDWIDMLKTIEDNDNIKALILRINSPGGTVAATQEIYNQILRLKDDGVIVVVSMGDMAASGAYYIACAADYIIANPGSLLGSIGVYMSSIEFSGLMDDLGITYNIIKSGENKDTLSPLREMTEEERELLQATIMDVYDQFLVAVADGREIDSDELRTIADGRIFSGRQALEVGLIDELGDFDKSIDIATEMAGITGEPNVVELSPGFYDFIEYIGYSFAGLMNKEANISLMENPMNEILQNNHSPVMYYYPY